MKRLIAIAAALNLIAACCAAKTALNVRDFGAQGDGLAKDTAAIQKALWTAFETRTNKRRVRVV